MTEHMLPTGLLRPEARRIGLGTGDLYAGAALAQSARIVQTAFDQGIRYFDTARMYGDGSAEEVLGSILPRVRSQVVIASKVGILPYRMLHAQRWHARLRKALRLAGPWARSFVAAPPTAAPRFGAFSRAELERSVHASLRALRTDYLDILLLHECRLDDASSPVVARFLDDLERAGKVRTSGIATLFPETCRILDAAPQRCAVVQIASDALDVRVASVPRCAGRLVVTHTPIKNALPRLLAYFAAHPDAATTFRAATGVGGDDVPALARWLLAEAMRCNADGVVLFSSSRPERIAEAARLVPNETPGPKILDIVRACA